MKQGFNSGFADIAVSKRKIKQEFFQQINTIVNWDVIATKLDKLYAKGQSHTGRPSYEGLLLFKITLLQTWYNRSDYEVEDAVNDRISFSRFVGLSLDDQSPDHSIISRFRTELTKNNAYEILLNEVNRCLAKHHILVKTGALIDASITDSPRQPRGKKEDVIDEQKAEEQDDANPLEVSTTQVEQTKTADTRTVSTTSVHVKQQKHVDGQARWVKKNGRLRYGYKKYVVTTDEGLVLGVHTTAANVHEISNLEEVLAKASLPKGCKIKADKGYKSKKNDDLLMTKGFKNHIMKKALKSKALTEMEIKLNKIVSKTRYKIERTFGSMVVWFGAGKARYVGLAKTNSQHLMEAIAFHLYRSPKMIMLQLQNQPQLLLK